MICEAHEGLLGLYIHFPFCRRLCGYCDFPTTAPVCIPAPGYTDAVLAELQVRSVPFRDRVLRSIYFGGGTPSLWPPAQLGRVIRAALDCCSHLAEVEVTLEANPGTLAPGQLEHLLQAGVTRLSLGVQSLDDRFLALLGRLHDAAQARQAVKLARRVGLASVGCDVIFGLPGQTLEHHLGQLGQVLELEPDHVSAYSLSLAEGTPMYRAGLRPGEDDLLAEMMEAGRELLQKAGLLQYEVSSFARPGHLCAHNVLLWAGEPYLGLGAFAHSMQQDKRGQSVRTASLGPDPYLAAWGGVKLPGRGERSLPLRVETVSLAGSRLEVVFLGLRTVQGVDRARYRRRFGADILAHAGTRAPDLVERGLLVVSQHHLSPTPRGIWHADALALRLVGRVDA